MLGRAHRRRRPLALVCRPVCLFCRREPWRDGEGVSCKPKDVRGRPGVPHTWDAAAWGIDPAEDYDRPEDDVPCRCGAPVGGYHHWECDLERCPWADDHPDDGEQLLFCGCFDDEDDAA